MELTYFTPSILGRRGSFLTPLLLTEVLSVDFTTSSKALLEELYIINIFDVFLDIIHLKLAQDIYLNVGAASCLQ